MHAQESLDLGIPEAPKKTRKADPVFDALALGCGLNISQMTRSARGAIARAAGEIREVRPGVTPADITRAIALYRSKYPTWTLTCTSLAKHWPSLWTDAKAVKQPPNVRAYLEGRDEK